MACLIFAACPGSCWHLLECKACTPHGECTTLVIVCVSRGTCNLARCAKSEPVMIEHPRLVPLKHRLRNGAVCPPLQRVHYCFVKKLRAYLSIKCVHAIALPTLTPAERGR